MSNPRGYGLNGQACYENVAKPTNANIQFAVAATNGLGITSLKSNGFVENVFMHTSTTPAVGNGGFLNPNPPAGYALIQMRNNFNVFLNVFGSIISPSAGSNLTAATANSVYVITALGTATLAQWQAVGFPAGFVPAVGASFIASASATIGGSATVKVPGVSGVADIEVVGSPSLMIANSNISSNAGARVLIQFLAATSPSVTTVIPAAPADGSVVSLLLKYDGSSVTVDGL